MLEYANITIPQQECKKDLGVYVNRKFKWNTHTQRKVSNSRRAFYKLKNTTPWCTPSYIKYKLYFAYVVSMALKSVACPLQTSGLSRISKKSAWDGFTGILLLGPSSHT